MKRYFDLEDFKTFLNLLEENKVTELFTEKLEDGSIEKYNYMKMKFNGNTIILYDTSRGYTGIIQDTFSFPWKDYVEFLFEDLTCNDEYKIFIK